MAALPFPYSPGTETWQDSEDFVNDLKSYEGTATIILTEEEREKYADLSGELQGKWEALNMKISNTREKTLSSRALPELKGSNANWGSFIHREEIQGTTLEELGITDIKTRHSSSLDILSLQQKTSHEHHQTVYEQGELTAPLARSIEEEEDADTTTESNWLCKGCSKYFATKASLKRHHDRKKSCKDLSDKQEKQEKQDLSGTLVELPVPVKPYIVDWIEQTMMKAISGNSEKPYCQFCEVEFANKSNLNKHLSKSIACDKLAKQEFLRLLHLS